MTRAVLDPNVLVSAFISQRGGSPDLIVRAWREGVFELVVSPQLIAELTDVLGRPKFALQANEGRAEAYIAGLAGDAIHVDDPPDPPAVSPDSSDDYLIALGRAARADVIVSGDSDLTQLVDPVPTVLTPRQFIEQLDVAGSASAPPRRFAMSRARLGPARGELQVFGVLRRGSPG
ncbi:MAG: putative toxin-antitoxin system toxin component, PIN family [Actinobacteria bacterium]|nr:MAG: putative toxin-antitoxin system toxin component, PIN family [Actinomycetota bacterium]